jgi:hypothetical protein
VLARRLLPPFDPPRCSHRITETMRETLDRGKDTRYLSTEARDTMVAFPAREYASATGRRVMKTLDGKELPPGSRDEEFLVTNGLSKPQPKMTGAEMASIIPPGGLGRAAPITLYSQRASEGVFPMSSASGSNPHARTAKFSTPIELGVPEHDGGMDHSRQRLTADRAALLRQGAGSELSVRDTMRSLRARLAERFGPSAVVRVQASFHAMDTSGNGHLSAEELAAGLRRLGVPVPGREVAQLVAWFDVDRSGEVDLAELINGLRGLPATGPTSTSWGLDTLSATRHGNPAGRSDARASKRAAVVDAAWEHATSGGGDDLALSVTDLVRALRPEHHPSVKRGIMSEAVAAREVATALDIEGSDGVVTQAEFVGYHRSLSACIEDDDEFISSVGGMWGVPSSSSTVVEAGSSAAGPVRRVEVTHDDGSVQVCEIVDHVGLTSSDEPAIRARLRRDGVKHVHSVRLLD